MDDSWESMQTVRTSSTSGMSRSFSAMTDLSHLPYSPSGDIAWRKSEGRRAARMDEFKRSVRFDDVITLDEVTEQLSRTLDSIAVVGERKRMLLSERLRLRDGHGDVQGLSTSSQPALLLRGSSSASSSSSSTTSRLPDMGNGGASSMPLWCGRWLSRPGTGPPDRRPSAGQLAPLSNETSAAVSLPRHGPGQHLADSWERHSSQLLQPLPIEGRTSVSVSLAALAARGFTQSVARNAARRMMAKAVADRLLESSTDDSGSSIRICIYFGCQRTGIPAEEELVRTLAAAVSSLGERATIILAGEPAMHAAFSTSYGSSSPGMPLWSLLPMGTPVPAGLGEELCVPSGTDDASCRDALGQLGDFYVTVESGSDVVEVASAAIARGVGLVPIAIQTENRVGVPPLPADAVERPGFVSPEQWEQLKSGTASAEEAVDIVASALYTFVEGEALVQTDADAIEFQIGPLKYAAKMKEQSKLSRPGPPGSTHLLAYYERDSQDSRIEWVKLDEARLLLTDMYGHESVPYRRVSKITHRGHSFEPASFPSKTKSESAVCDHESPLLNKRRTRAQRHTVVSQSKPVRDMQKVTLPDIISEEAEDNFEDHNVDPDHVKVFKRLAVQGDIPSEHLADACTQLGYWLINQDWIDTLVRTKFNNRAFLDMKEFCSFAELYQELFKKCMMERFNAADRRQTGRLGPADVSQWLRRMQITPVKGVVEELMSEASGDNPREFIDLEQFVTLNSVVWRRVGFTLREVAVFKDILARYPALAAGNHGEAGIKELRSCMRWLGFPASLKQVEMLMAEAFEEIRSQSPQVSGVTEGESERDFLILMRRQREHWIRRVMRAFSFQDQIAQTGSPDGCLEHHELLGFLEKLGFVAMPEAVQEAIDDCRLTQKTGLIFEDLYHILETFRTKEGFLKEELEDIRDTYGRFDKKGMDGIGGVQLSGALRWAGWRHSSQEVQDIMVDYDIDENEEISELEFVKLAKSFRERLIDKLQKHFKERDLDAPGRISEKEFRNAIMRYLDVRRPQDRQVAQIWEKHREKFESELEGDVDCWDWVRLVLDYWKAERDLTRENQGFNHDEVRKFRTRFQAYDFNSTGYVSLADRTLANLLDEVFPDMRSNFESHQRATDWLAEVEQRKDGAIDFHEFLRMMRQVQDDADEELLRDEEEARIAAELSRDEVKEFRKIFASFDSDFSGQMSYNELKDMLGGLISIDKNAAGALKTALEAVDGDGNRELSFPEFLRLMKKLQSENWNEINSAAAERSKVAVCLQEAQQETYRKSLLAKKENIHWVDFMNSHMGEVEDLAGEDVDSEDGPLHNLVTLSSE